jgi:hypothetical protein
VTRIAALVLACVTALTAASVAVPADAVITQSGTESTTTAGSGGTVARPYLAYGERSFFQSELVDAPVDVSLTRQFRSFMRSHPDQKGVDYPKIRGTEGNRWGMVHDLSDCSDPVWKLQPTARAGTAANPAAWQRLTVKGRGFHANAALGSWLTGTSDSPLVVIDRCSGISVWAAKAAKGNGRVISVGSFGAFKHSSNGLDRRNPRSNSHRNERSRGVIPDSMLIRRDLMKYAVAHNSDLGHVLEIFFVETDSSAGYARPMVNMESGKFGFGAQGTRIAISPTVRLARRHCSPEGLVLARTLKRYGGYLGDNAGSATSIKAEQETPTHAVWRGSLTADELRGCITWDDFVVIKKGWH